MSIGEQIETIVNSMTGNNYPPQLVTIKEAYTDLRCDIETENGTILQRINCSTQAITGTKGLLTYENGDQDKPFVIVFESAETNSISDVTDLQSSLDGKAPLTHEHDTTMVIEESALTGIGTFTGATQHTINVAFDEAINDLSSIKAIEVVSTLPTASSSTMNQLYIVSEDSKVNVYYTTQSGSTYSWHKMDSDILDELSLDWSAILNNPFSSSTPSSFANASHTHGNITNDGKLGSSSGQILVTTTNGVITATGTLESGQINYRYEGQPISLSTMISNLITSMDNKAPTPHDSTSSTYGLGSTTNYGHVKTVNSVAQSYHSNGLALSAYQGYRLNQAIQGKQNIGDCITSIELVPKTEDDTGAIRLYYGDEE